MDDKNLVFETFNTAGEYIKKVRTAILKAAQSFQTGRENEALDVLKGLPEGINWLIQVKKLTENFDSSYRIGVDCGKLNDALVRIVNAQENNDYVSIADCLEYMLLPAILQYENELSRVQGEFN